MRESAFDTKGRERANRAGELGWGFVRARAGNDLSDITAYCTLYTVNCQQGERVLLREIAFEKNHKWGSYANREVRVQTPSPTSPLSSP